MRLVLDACVLVKLLIREDGSDQAIELYGRATEAHVPDYVFAECANTLWKKRRQGALDKQHALGRLEAYLRLDLVTHKSADLLPHATELAILLDHPVYDCLYLALAMAEGCELLTCDGKLAQKAASIGLGERVKLLGAT